MELDNYDIIYFDNYDLCLKFSDEIIYTKKIIVSSSNSINKFCYIHGLIHIMSKSIPSNVDCVVTNDGIIIHNKNKNKNIKIPQEEILQFDRTVSEKRKPCSVKKSNEKFQSSVIKDAIRLDYAFKRESYKKEMRKPSFKKTSLVKSTNKGSYSSLTRIESVSSDDE